MVFCMPSRRNYCESFFSFLFFFPFLVERDQPLNSSPRFSPAPVRGAGTGVASFLNRVAGLIAPVLAAVIPGDGTTTPIYLSGTLIFAAFVGIVLIPIETRGRQRL